jgi:hypothetical protein
MAAHRVHLRNDSHAEFRIRFGNGNGRTQAGAAAADEHNVV